MPRRVSAYQQRINLVLDYIRAHLGEDLSLATLAAVAGFSPFHFHRLFRALTDETVNACVNRLRLERAVQLLRGSSISVTAAALECGFASGSRLSRVFKKQYGLTARAWDREQPLQVSKNGQVLEGFPRYTCVELQALARALRWRVTIRDLPAQRLAYIRVYDSYRRSEAVLAAFERLVTWAERHGFGPGPGCLYGMSPDDPAITPLRLCRFDWAVVVPAGVRRDDVVDVVDWPATQLASLHIRGDVHAEDRAFQYLFQVWLPRSRYLPAHLPALEIYRRLPRPPGWSDLDLECAVPVSAF
jgi:AraC family transcriptional regulator